MYIYLLRSLITALFMERQLLYWSPFTALHSYIILVCFWLSIRRSIVVSLHTYHGGYALAFPWRIPSAFSTGGYTLAFPWLDTLGLFRRHWKRQLPSSYCLIMVSTSVIGSLRIHGLAEYIGYRILRRGHDYGVFRHIHQMLHSWRYQIPSMHLGCGSALRSYRVRT